MNRIPNPDIEVPDEKVARAGPEDTLVRTVGLISMISLALFSTRARFLLE